MSYDLTFRSAGQQKLWDCLHARCREVFVRIVEAFMQHGRALVRADGQPVAYQVVQPTAAGPASIEFLVDLPPYATRTYAFA